eukprot:GEMP01070395.1.p1 GENE.GEMP01070395.1~~GEMP01070395.1.p1  ORF type:complete len:204 (+),score=61.23 GEMP01070395.1:151-762(+)
MTDWVPPPELEIQNYSHVGDQELQHWINEVRFNMEKSVMAEKQAIMATHVADLTANKAIAAAAHFYKWNTNQQMLLQPPAPTVEPPMRPLVRASDIINAPTPQAFPTIHPQGVHPPSSATTTPGIAGVHGGHAPTPDGAQNTLQAFLGKTAATQRMMPLEWIYVVHGEMAKGCQERLKKWTHLENSVRARVFLGGVSTNRVSS